MSTTPTPIDFIDAKGGPAQIAKDIAERVADESQRPRAGAIALWRHRNKIPRAAWPELMETYPELTLAHLKAMEAAGAAEPEKGAA